MRSQLRTLAALVLSLAVFSSLAPPPVRAQAQNSIPMGKWVVDWGEQQCSLVRRMGDAEDTTIVIRTLLGTDTTSLVLASPRWNAPPMPKAKGPVELVLAPTGERIRGRLVLSVGEAGDHALSLTMFQEDFSAHFAQASAMAFEADGRRFFNFDLPASGAAMKALQSCNEDLLATWGVDPKLMASLRKKATITKSDVSPYDYPRASIRNKEEGTAVVRLTVGMDGRAKDCKVVSSSGYTSLDEQSCHSLVQRVRFDPAIDAHGQPVSAPFVTTVTWKLPE